MCTEISTLDSEADALYRSAIAELFKAGHDALANAGHADASVGRSDWPLWMRIVKPTTGRVQHLPMTVRVSSHSYGRC